MTEAGVVTAHRNKTGLNSFNFTPRRNNTGNTGFNFFNFTTRRNINNVFNAFNWFIATNASSSGRGGSRRRGGSLRHGGSRRSSSSDRDGDSPVKRDRNEGHREANEGEASMFTLEVQFDRNSVHFLTAAIFSIILVVTGVYRFPELSCGQQASIRIFVMICGWVNYCLAVCTYARQLLDLVPHMNEICYRLRKAQRIFKAMNCEKNRRINIKELRETMSATGRFPPRKYVCKFCSTILGTFPILVTMTIFNGFSVHNLLRCSPSS